MIVRGVKRPSKPKVHVITLGCSKNLVDSEELMAQLRDGNVEITPDEDRTHIVVINTCGFIEAAKEESIHTILAAAAWKKKKKGRKVYVMGCLSERYGSDLEKEIPEVDGYFGSNTIQPVVEKIGIDYKNELLGERFLTTPRHFAYLKISEGCDNPCSFCSIPLMRGLHRSKPIEQIRKEAEHLASQGVKEIIIIGQDTTYYGLDLYGKRRLSDVLRILGEVEGIRWIRLMYAYPAKFPLDVIDAFTSIPALVPYIDIPIQHISTSVLRSMRRGLSRQSTIDLLNRLRDSIPRLAIRTTLIVGYPAEREREYEELAAFVDQGHFHRLGVFTYSREDGTISYLLGDPVSPEEKERRRSEIMQIQQRHSLNRNIKLIGSEIEVVIDEYENGSYFGRTCWDAPEVDNQVIIPASEGQAEVGSLVKIKVTDATEYDLFGKIIGRSASVNRPVRRIA
jgi:ribosomal protein S12 methylthiotransferase